MSLNYYEFPTQHKKRIVNSALCNVYLKDFLCNFCIADQVTRKRISFVFTHSRGYDCLRGYKIAFGNTVWILLWTQQMWREKPVLLNSSISKFHLDLERRMKSYTVRVEMSLQNSNLLVFIFYFVLLLISRLKTTVTPRNISTIKNQTLITVCHTFILMLVLRIEGMLKKYFFGDQLVYSQHLSMRQCREIVRRLSILISTWKTLRL